MIEQQLKDCPLGQMLNSLRKPAMAKSPLNEKVLRVASQIMVTLPMNTCELIEIKDRKDKKPLRHKLENVIRVMTTGSCSTEGLNDGLTILSEAMRTFSDGTSLEIYNNLFTAVSKLGSELLPQIDHLIENSMNANLPAEMQNEARRARAQHVEMNMMLYNRFLFRGAGPSGHPQGPGGAR